MKLFIFALFCCLGIWSTEAYQCYTCAGATESVCNDPFNKANMGDQYKVTAKPYERCYKSKVLGEIVTRTVVNATECGQGENKCVTADVPFFGKSTTCCCNSNLCNGASSIQQQFLIPFAVIGTLTVLFYRLF